MDKMLCCQTDISERTLPDQVKDKIEIEIKV